LRNVIISLRRIARGKIIVVFGCGGERDRLKRPKMGRVASGLSDYCVVTSDNPRSEEPEDIAADILRGVKKKNFSVILDRREAIRHAISAAAEGDIVLVAGKGHENYQIFKDKTLHFDDREIVKACLSSAN
jgi:UDP-N-acetylmuramoyl-L-alanyl-D-glutamate--2,6-diaminopimelate ligase